MRVSLVFTTFLLTVLLAAGGCVDDDIQHLKEYDAMQDHPMETTHNAKVLFSDSARIKAHLTTPVMKRFRQNQEQLEFPDGLKLVFFSTYPDTSANVRSNYGIRYIEEQRTELRQDVVVVNQAGDTLETEHLIWEEQKEKIHSDELVKVTTPDEVIIGKGFESDPSFREYTFYEIRGTIKAGE